MKIIVLLFLMTLTPGVHAQTIKEWLGLTPIPLEKPALNEVKNVEGKIFTEDSYLTYATLNTTDLLPDAEKPCNRFHDLSWTKAGMLQDTVCIPRQTKPSLGYYGFYINNAGWMTGKLHFKLFGKTEIYIDGILKATVETEDPMEKSIPMEWLPGKHLILVKTINKGGKILHASFEADPGFKDFPVEFSLSPKRGKTIYDILNGKRPGRISVSYSGKYAIVGMINTVNGKSSATTHIYRIADKKIVYTFYGNSAQGIQWLPGKDQLSYLRGEENNKSLYLYDPDEQTESCLIGQDKYIRENPYIWSPDHSYLIYYQKEKFTDPGWQLRKLHGIEDRQEYFRIRSYLCKYDFTTGLHSRLTWGNLTTSLMDISKDGKKLLFSTLRPDYNEYPFEKMSVYMMDLSTRQVDTLWKDHPSSFSCHFSPDGKKLLILGGPSVFGRAGENIGKQPIANPFDTQMYFYDLATRKTEAVSRDFAPAIEEAIWHKDGNIYLKAVEGDFVRLYRYKDHKFTRIDCPGDIILQLSLARNSDQMMYTASEWNYPPRIYTINVNNEQAVLWQDPARQQYENIVFGEMKDWDYPYKKGTTIDGRYYLPLNFDPAKKYPLIVYYYGGTTPVDRTFGGRWPFNLYAANGYVVYILQPSGTIGYGQEFSARHQNNWGKITGNEIIASVKAFIQAHSFIDASKVGCMGASYGGFTTEYLLTRTDIFACAISHAGISSLSGYWGEGYWGYSYSTGASAHAYPWNRKDIYVEQSPLFSADKVKTPILLIHGTKDVNVPTGQSIQLYTALKLLGKDAELVFVKDADHTVVDYTQRIIWNNTILSYFAKYLKDQPAWWEQLYKDLNL